jgi:sugar lactone lactonase YvrE
MLKHLPLPALLLLAACSGAPAPQAAAPTLEKLWVASDFAAPESIVQAPDGNYLVSNVGIDEGDEKNGDGFITKISANGDLIEKYWAAKLNGPKGLAIKDGTLYAADIDAVMLIDAEAGGLGTKIPVDGATFLNDVTVWGDAVYVSDSGTGRIHRIADGAATVWLEDARFGGINGLLGDGDRMLVSTMGTGSLYSVTADGKVTEIATGMPDADGIGLMAGGGYLVTSWPGQIHYVSEDGTVTTLVDTTSEGILQNDLTRFDDIFIVPNWAPGTLTAWKVVR